MANKPEGMSIVASGHTADDLETQIEEAKAFIDCGIDAYVFISNRFAKENEDDDVFLKNMEYVASKLPEIPLGVYECPYPYKRLVTPKILDFCLSTGKFYYMKDTCCDAAVIKERIEQLKGSSFKLLNANCQTLLQTMRDGADGYCGIMCNFHPYLYAWLGENFEKEPEKADFIQSVIGTFGFTEVGLPYPLTAKYHMNLCGIPTENIARNRKSAELTDYARDCMKQMKYATDSIEKMLSEKEL
jgi:4-hydroxy-tetrahydrodipicolinate synthase